MYRNWGSNTVLLMAALFFAMVASATSGCNVSGQAITLLSTPAPTLTAPVPTPTVTPPATLTPAPTPTVTPTPDLSTAIVRVQDLPPGFEPVPASDLSKFNFSESAIADSFSRSGVQARPKNLFVFAKNSPKLELIVGFILYPLSATDRAAMDASLSNPDSLLRSLAAGFANGGRATKSSSVVPGLDKFGDRSVGVTALPSMGSPQLRMDAVVARRGSVAQVVCLIYPDGSAPSVEIGPVALALDSRIATTLGR